MSIAIVTDCLTEQDQQEGRPLSGASGWHLDQMLSAAGISRRDCEVLPVFNLRPKGDDVKNLCGPKGTALPGRQPLLRGKYVRTEFAGELLRFDNRLIDAAPNIIIALGSTALWALTGEMGIRQHRGVTRLSQRGVKVLPTYHPGAVIRQWTLRPIVIADFQKAASQSTFREYNVPERRIHIPESIDEILAFERQHFPGAIKLACDIETKQEQITCIGFAPSPSDALVLPFFTHAGENYWQTKAEELEVWATIRRWLAEYPTVYQNGLYDMGYLWRVYGLPAPKNCDDTMLLHHALQPEMDKGLGFLASLYTNEPSWKQMGKGMKHD